ncbi:glutathione synthase [Cokeromyces recurvatus]|uniref:glutathione synthase n=1 Tax=Cokeromyces recurvatus TaxID=90255 RepID=UPI0022201A50|nr:glutathione synthase [Cokeromyces recurvatus]KAI7904154.1 glutathione synthase [Cokeromyces recurvatus]
MKDNYISLKELEGNIVTEAIDWALSHGLVIRPTKDQITNNTSFVMHAPFALYPSPFPLEEFEKAKSLQQTWNTLIHKMSRDDDLISETMETLSKLDEFMNRLYQIYLTVKKEGVAQTASLGIHRNDYLLHTSKDSKVKIQQVEFNTISSSFGSLSKRTGELHRFLLSSIDGYAEGHIKMDQLPENNSIEAIANGLALAWKHYGNPNARIAMIVQPGERNAFDQRWIEYTLLEKHGILLTRLTLEDIATRAKLNPKSKALTIDGYEIAVSYFRAGYGPEDYPSETEWDARLVIERSLAIKCPTVAYQLVGSKKVQQVLSEPNRLERYIQTKTSEIRDTFAGLYSLDSTTEAGQKAYKMALERPDDFVMKPQREGGGHNIYGKDILTELERLKPEERNSYILMDLIKSPPLQNVMIREGKTIVGDVVSELGIFGTFLADDEKEILNEVGGHLLRTKATTTREGGVAAGFAVIDSPLLV